MTFIQKVMKSVAGLVFVGLAAILSTQDYEALTTNKIFLSTEVSHESMHKLLEQINQANDIIVPFERTVVTLNSPGGSADALVEFQRASKGSIPIDTYISVGAASAAALAFLEGERRMMHPEATIMFHGVRIIVPTFHGIIVITAPDARNILSHGQFREDTADINKTTIAAMKERNAYDAFIAEIKDGLKGMVDEMEQLDVKMIEYVAEKLNVGQLFVKENLIVPNKDVRLSAAEAKRMGVANIITDLGA